MIVTRSVLISSVSSAASTGPPRPPHNPDTHTYTRLWPLRSENLRATFPRNTGVLGAHRTIAGQESGNLRSNSVSATISLVSLGQVRLGTALSLSFPFWKNETNEKNET